MLTTRSHGLKTRSPTVLYRSQITNDQRGLSFGFSMFGMTTKRQILKQCLKNYEHNVLYSCILSPTIGVQEGSWNYFNRTRSKKFQTDTNTTSAGISYEPGISIEATIDNLWPTDRDRPSSCCVTVSRCNYNRTGIDSAQRDSAHLNSAQLVSQSARSS